MASDQNEGEWQTAGQRSRRAPKRGEGPSNATNQSSRLVPSQAQRPVGQDSGRDSRGNTQLPLRGPGLPNEPRSNLGPRPENSQRNRGYGQSGRPQPKFNPNEVTGQSTGSTRASSQAQPIQQRQGEAPNTDKLQKNRTYQ